LKFRTGKLPKLSYQNTPQYHGLMHGVAPIKAPDKVNWTTPVSMWPMLGNDRVGDCTIACPLHAVQLWTADNGRQIIPSDECAIDDYAVTTGYNPATGANDNGAFIISILQYWMHTGLAVTSGGALDVLDGFAEIDPGDIAQIKAAIWMFGAVDAGVELPVEAMTQFEDGQAWTDLTGTKGSEGGHCIPLVGYDADGIYCVTWGRVQRLSWAWWKKYSSESYALLRRSWIGTKGLAPSGLSLQELDSRILSMRGQLGLGAAA
jgi:hypothetical protein